MERLFNRNLNQNARVFRRMKFYKTRNIPNESVTICRSYSTLSRHRPRERQFALRSQLRPKGQNCGLKRKYTQLIYHVRENERQKRRKQRKVLAKT